jgi:aminopeptidase N
VEGVELNGEEVPKDAFDGARIRLDHLKEANELHILGSAAYQNVGAGMSRFVDPIDNRVYLHSQFEPFDAHRVYPCFDQPDLKGRFTFTVLAPADWEVISNTASSKAPVEGGKVRWAFATTPKMSCYITAIVAGPYHVVRDRHGEIDLGLYCRQSLKQYLDAEEIFTITKQGLDFYGKAYAYPYPFGKKYDQLFVPEFKHGAMENAACVTFTEYYIFRSKVTEAAREGRADTILHEMAHMWWGDLVTMRWWDDLWLNESFATFMAFFSEVEATRFKNGWTTFANQIKAGARRQDQLPTTHPISANIPDIESVHLNFDQITYDKGASVLRQLVAWVGQDTFLRGVQRYLKTRQWGNASLDEFLSDVEQGSGRNLSAWSEDWLQTAGLNTLTPVIRWRDGGDGSSIASFSIEQEAPEQWPTLRPHRLALGLYDRTPGGLELRRRIELDVTGAITPVTELKDERAPDFLLLNDGDLAYAKVRFDDRSLQTARDHLATLRDPLARAVSWGAFWDMLRDARLPAREFLPIVLNNIHGEDDIGVVQNLLGQAGSAIYVYGDPANAKAASQMFADHALRVLDQAEPGSDVQLVWARAFIGAAASPDHLRRVRGVLDGTVAYKGLKVDTDLRWGIVTALAGDGAADESLIDAELQRDPTDMGQRYAAGARAARPTPEAKAQAWSSIRDDRSLPLAMVRSIMRGFHRPDQRPLLEPYVQPYFEALEPVWKERDIEIALDFARGMYPAIVVGDDVVNRTTFALDRATTPGPVRRILLEGRDQMQRTIRARALDASAKEPASTRR